MLRVGAHVSTRQGYAGAARAASAMGAAAFQFFPKNPRSLLLKRQIDVQDARTCAQWCSANGIFSIGHAPYALNLAADADRRPQMVEALLNALSIADLCGAYGVVVHFGKYLGNNALQGYQNIIQCTNEALRQWNGAALLLIENQAGEGTMMGATFEEAATIRRLSDYPNKIGYCLDTCHAFASGLWNGDNWEEAERRAIDAGYLPHLKAIHLNDSLYPCGARRDRHAPIGQGCIGAAGFRGLLRSEAIRGVPLILETPKGADGTHAREIELVKSLVQD